MPRVYLGLGSNVDAKQNLRLGIRELRERYGTLDISDVYENAAVGFVGADFLNMVVGLQSDETPREIQREAERIHELAGRDRGSDKFSARPLDIDLLLYDDHVINEPNLKIPRGDILDYSFVLRPLAELEPDLVHPVTGKTMQQHWQEFDTAAHPLQAIDLIL